jgi:hypothetical protein
MIGKLFSKYFNKKDDSLQLEESNFFDFDFNNYILEIRKQIKEQIIFEIDEEYDFSEVSPDYMEKLYEKKTKEKFKQSKKQLKNKEKEIKLFINNYKTFLEKISSFNNDIIIENL